MRIDLKVPYQDAARVAKLHREGARYERPTKTWYVEYDDLSALLLFREWISDEVWDGLVEKSIPAGMVYTIGINNLPQGNWSYPPMPFNAPTPLTPGGIKINESTIFVQRQIAEQRKERDRHMKILDEAQKTMRESCGTRFAPHVQDLSAWSRAWAQERRGKSRLQELLIEEKMPQKYTWSGFDFAATDETVTYDVATNGIQKSPEMGLLLIMK